VALPAFACRATVRRTAIDRYILPAAQVKFADVRAAVGQTYRRTPGRCMAPAAHAGSASNNDLFDGRDRQSSVAESASRLVGSCSIISTLSLTARALQGRSTARCVWPETADGRECHS